MDSGRISSVQLRDQQERLFTCAISSVLCPLFTLSMSTFYYSFHIHSYPINIWLIQAAFFYLSISEILAYQQKGSILTCRSKLPPLLKYYNQILSVLTPISSILISALTNKHGAIGPHEFEIGLRKQVKDGIFFRARAALKVQQR
jgi:hypothetical protein